MESTDVKQAIAEVLSQNMGQKLGKTFFDGYSDQTIPIYVDTAFKLLSELTGKKKAREQINSVLMKFNVKKIDE